MKSVLLLDFQKDLGNPIRKAVTGTFGSKTEVDGLIGSLYQKRKSKNPIIPPLYLAYAARIFNDRGWEVSHSYSFTKKKYDLIIFASSMPGSFDEVEALKHYKKRNMSKLIIAGAFAKEVPDIYKEVADAIIVDGEPESVFIELANEEVDFPLKNINLNAKKQISSNELPLPLWEIFNYKDFNYSPMLKGASIPVLTSRGCPYNCDYCHYMPEVGPNLRNREVDRVIDEIIYLKKLGISNIIFRDLVFTLNKSRVISLCNKINELDFSISWAIETRIDKLSYELLDTMKAAGLKHLNLGIESPDPKALIKVGRKPADLEFQENIIKYIHKIGLSISAFYIIGFVDDTQSSINRLINYAKKLNTLAAQFCLMTPFPGTKLYEDLKSRIITNDWSNFSEYRPTLKLDHLSSEELIKFRDKAYRSYYARPNWFFRHWRKLL
jgi:radical SAM superfamily enzyme YgiQ (UPF0313 family)